MKIKRLLASLLVSILVITSLPTGVFAYEAMDDEKIYEKTGGSPLEAEYYVKLTSRNEIIPQALTEESTFFTTDFSAIYTVPAFNTRVTELASYSSCDSSYQGSFRRIMTLHTDGKTNPAEFTIEYISYVSYSGNKHNVSTKTESAANMFYFAKYPDTFPIKDFITYSGDTKRQIYFRYSDSDIRYVNVATREKLGKANAIYAGNTTYGLTLSSHKDKVCWYFDKSNKTIVYGTSDGSTIPSPTTIPYEEWYTNYVVPNVSEKLDKENIKVEESDKWTDKNFVFVINQTKLAPRNQSCWTCAQEAIVMNSGCLNKTEYQLTGVVTDSSHKGWAKWSDKMKVSATATGPVSFCAVMNSNDLCKSKGSWTQGSSGDIDATAGSSGGAYIIGWNNNGTTQYLKDMSEQQLKTVLKAFYNSGYWCTIGVRNYDKPTHAAKPNGQEDEFTSNHTVMFAGIKDNNHIMILDSAGTAEGTDGSKVTDYVYAMDGAYRTYGLEDKKHNVVYIMAFKFSDEKNSLKAICGGTDAFMTEADQYNLQNMGINNKKGYFTEDQLSSKVVLSEADLSGVLSGATLDNLTQEDLESLQSWKDLTAEEDTLTKVIRIIVQVIGVVMLLWAILLYLGYHFDRTNNLIDISIVNILTLGKLRPVTSDSEEATFGKDKTEKKNKVSTVNSRNILAICLTVALFAVLILTGVLYNILASLVVLINSFLRG